MTNPLTRRPKRRGRTLAFLLTAAALALASFNPVQSVAGEQRGTKPTIVLVHGSWADASSWNRVTERLQDDGYTVRAIPNHLRSVAGDAASVRTFLETVPGPVVLVGHSYGGFVITNAATGLPNVKALVYVNAFAPDTGENPFQLVGPDSALAVDPATVFDLVPATLPPTATTDVYLKRSTVFASFATGLSSDDKDLVFATQRPGAFGALNEPSATPAWKTIPSWSAIGIKDQIIPASAQRMMSKRAGAKITEYDAGHLGLMTDPGTVTNVIKQAARS
ncbi:MULTISPECIES: alpha/beta hydrolase [unclassified Kribbella]|uniref:alpha/beta fold hydrolase n=1 Tax=unclassified Kribbella TaxID=2644121 RepID=UPI0033CBDC69